MKKMPRPYDTVVMNGEPDATVYRVSEIGEGMMVGLVDASIEREGQRVQWTDISLIETASRAQLKNAGLI